MLLIWIYITAAVCYLYSNPSRTRESTECQSLVHQCTIVNQICKKHLASRAYAKAHSTNAHNLVNLLLICCGDVSVNPGPTVSDFTSRVKPHNRPLIFKMINKQKKYIESMLHGQFLKQYQNEGVPPLGLRLQKFAHVRNNRKLNKTW